MSKGHFAKGYDPRQHRLTPAEPSRGGRTTWRRAMYEEPWLLRWLQIRIDATRRKAG
jgi:hypothetical protein